MIQNIRLFGLALLLSVGIGSVGNAASFDCDKATTETEIAICSDPELSALDELLADKYMLLEGSGKYDELAKRHHRSWEKTERTADVYSLQKQLDNLRLFSIVSDCQSVEGNTFANCNLAADQHVQTCIGLENFTTNAMNRCGLSQVSVYEEILTLEVEEWVERLSGDPQTQQLFLASQAKWRDFVKADCDWQWSEFRDGTIRGQIYAGCMIGHLTARLLRITASNWSEQ